MKFLPNRIRTVLFLAIRYSKGRSPFLKLMNFLSTFGVFVGVCALIVVLSVMTGIRKQIRDKILGVTPHILIAKHGDVIENWKEIIEKIESLDGVRGVFPLVVGNAIMRKDKISASVVVQCIPPEYIRKALLYERFLKDGSIFGGNKVNVGKVLAKNLDIHVGDKVLLISPYGGATLFGFVPNSLEAEISGVVEVGIFDWDSVFVFMDLSACDELFDTANWVSSIAVMLDDPDRAEIVSLQMEGRLGENFLAIPWTRTQKNLFSAMKLEKLGMTIILSLIIVIASFNILSTITVLVRDKMKDIAILKVFGFSSWEIRFIFMGVGLWIGLRGIIMGTLGGVIISFLISKYGIVQLPEDVYFISRLPSELSLGDIFLSWFVAFFSSFLSSFFPVSRALRREPFEVLRREL